MSEQPMIGEDSMGLAIEAYLGRRKQRKANRQAWQASLAVATVLVGVVNLMRSEDLDLSETLYLVTQIVTTIGYGDIAINGDGERVFLTFYALWALVPVAFFLNAVIQSALDAQEDRLKQRLCDFEAQWMYPDSEPQHRDVERIFGKYNRLVFAMCVFVGHLLFGTFFFAYWERCTCSYGQLEKGNCTAQTACENGYTIDLHESLYMSVVTLTTVGFGDFSPKSFSGRVVGIFWMVSGIVSTAKFLQAVQLVFLEVEEESKLDDFDLLNEKLFAEMDDNKDGSLSENDFLHYCIVQQQLVDPAVLRSIKDLYRTIDHDKSKTISFHDIKRYMWRKTRRRTAAETFVKNTGCVTM